MSAVKVLQEAAKAVANMAMAEWQRSYDIDAVWASQLAAYCGKGGKAGAADARPGVCARFTARGRRRSAAASHRGRGAHAARATGYQRPVRGVWAVGRGGPGARRAGFKVFRQLFCPILS